MHNSCQRFFIYTADVSQLCSRASTRLPSSCPLFDHTLRSAAISSSYPVPPTDKSDTSLGVPEIFSHNASDSDSSTAPNVFDSSSEPNSESKDKSDDGLASEKRSKFH
ncbi:hypothetical protein PENANT_c029G10280 [Penicillium antarcticum]|uniref:Uncharacterized protein n=1 Tax=Penicillium antarcticum TaxID=416450 RepID=A0A1V6PW70_9EURO|nr:hypothetical protein PENANT_c029G10280 [Penicillium antarcticum]